MKKIEIKVDINCEICKTDVMSTVTKLKGIAQVSLDTEKGILAITGDVDPVCVVKRLKKIKKNPKIVSLGPPKPPEPKTVEPKQPPLPPVCRSCEIISVTTYDSGGGCSIL